MPPSPSRIHWKGFPRYCLPRIRIVSASSIIHDSPAFASRDVFRSPLGEAFERTRQLQQMRARRHRIARSQATFPNLAVLRKSVRGDKRVVTTNSGRQVIFPHRRSERRRSSSQSQRRRSPSRSNRRASGQSRQSARSRQLRHARRLTAQQKLIHSRRSLRRAVSSTRGEPRRSTSSRGIYSGPRRSTSSRSIYSQSSPRRSTSSRSSVVLREPSTRSVPAATRLPRIQIHKSRSLRSHTPVPRLASPAPYWGAIPSPIPARRTPLEKQTFVSRRVGGKYIHEPIPLKQPSNDFLHRGLSNSSNYSRKSRVYDKRLPTRKAPAETVNGFIILPDAQPSLPLLFPSSLDFAKLDGSSARSSPSTSSSSTRRMYPDEDSSSNIVNVDVASRTTSEARALNDFTQGLQQHLQERYNEGPRPRSPSVAQTVVSTHTLQDLVAFREEFKAAGLAVTSRDQKGARSQRQSERSTPPKVKVQPSRAAAARRPSIVAASAIAPPQTTFSTLNVPLGVELKSPRSISPLNPGRNPALIAVRSSIDQGSSIAERSKIPIPKEKAPIPKAEKPSPPKKPLPWLKNPGQLPPGQEPLSAFNLRSEAPSRATNNSSVTTIIDFSPHPSEFWDKQGLDFNDFQNRHPNLSMDRDGSPDFDDPPGGGGIIMLENEIKQPIAMVSPPERAPERILEEERSKVIIHDKSGPPKPLRIEVSEGPRMPHGGGGHRAPSPLQTQLFPEDIDNEDDIGNGLVRADSFDDYQYDKASSSMQGLPMIPDFSSFATSSGSASWERSRSSVTRPKSAGDERDDMPRPVGRRASKEEIWAEKRRRSKEDILRQARGQAQYDEQRTKFEIKKVTPWELGSESTGTGDGRKQKKAPDDEHPQIEIIGTKSEAMSSPRSEKPDGMDGAEKEWKGLFGHGKLNLRSKMRGLFGTDRESSRSSNEDDVPAAAQSVPSLPTLPAESRGPKARDTRGKEREKVHAKQTIVVPECEECQNPHSGNLSNNRPSSLNEPKSARSFQEWQAGVPFKPLSRESSVNEHQPEELLPCGHRKRNTESRLGDPVKRNVAARRTKPPPSITGSRAPSIFTIQETVPKAAPKIAPPPSSQPAKKPVEMSAPDSSSDISDGDVLKGLGIVMEGVLNSDVEAWINEATGTNVRRFLADLSAMNKLGTGVLANTARRNASKRQRAMEKIGSHKKGRSEGSVL